MRRLALLGLASISDQHGKSVRLSELLATRRYVVLAFYVKAFTSG